MSSDGAEQFCRIIRDVDAEYLKSSNAPPKKKGEVDEVPINDADATKQVFSRLTARANEVAAKRKKPKANGNS